MTNYSKCSAKKHLAVVSARQHRLSVTRVIHTKTVEDRIMKFSPYCSPIPLVFVGKV